jgi:hypothetical protein
MPISVKTPLTLEEIDAMLQSLVGVTVDAGGGKLQRIQSRRETDGTIAYRIIEWDADDEPPQDWHA